MPNDGSIRIEELSCPYGFDSGRNEVPSGIGEAHLLAYNAVPAVPHRTLRP